MPWEIVETLPSTDRARIDDGEGWVATAWDDAERPRALVGLALTRYWAVQEGLTDETWEEHVRRRERDLGEAAELARRAGDVDVVAESLLGRLYGLWGPDHLAGRGALVDELQALHPDVTDEELRLRIREWAVLGHLDTGDLDAAQDGIERFAAEAAGTDLVLFRRREELWRGNVAMLEGRIDEAIAINQAAISSTAGTAGSPFSFQNVAISIAIERFFRRGLDEVIDSIRSIRASSPRVAANWDTGLAFALAETGALDEAAELFGRVAADDFAAVPRDLNWLVTMQLLGLISLHLDDGVQGARLLAHLRPFAELDATHGSGYASYGPVGRVVASLAARYGDPTEARRWFDFVLGTRSPGPWTSLTRLDRAVAFCESDPGDAAEDAGRAQRELRSFGLDAWADRARALHDGLLLAGHGPPIAYLEVGAWVLRHPSGTATVPDGVGMGYLTRLLARPGEAFDATALEATDPSLPPTSAAMEALDAPARRAYRQRLAALERSGRPLSGAEQAERDFLRRELAGAAHTPSVSAELERARVRVTKAIRRAIDAAARQSPGLGTHLAETIETGRRCTYAPATGAAWRVVVPRSSDGG